jgi:hypothetical protein
MFTKIRGDIRKQRLITGVTVMSTLRCRHTRQDDIVANVSSPVSLLPAINYRRCHGIRDKAKSPVSTIPAIIYRW